MEENVRRYSQQNHPLAGQHVRPVVLVQFHGPVVAGYDRRGRGRERQPAQQGTGGQRHHRATERLRHGRRVETRDQRMLLLLCRRRRLLRNRLLRCARAAR